MQLVTKEVYIAMVKRGLIKSSKNSKNYYISGKSKGSKRKRYYVCESDYRVFLRRKW